MDAERSTELIDQSSLLHRENSTLSAIAGELEGGRSTEKPDHDSKYRRTLTWQRVLLLSSIPVLTMPIILFFQSVSSPAHSGFRTNPDSLLAIQLEAVLFWILSHF
jgi:hypothetical protein